MSTVAEKQKTSDKAILSKYNELSSIVGELIASPTNPKPDVVSHFNEFIGNYNIAEEIYRSDESNPELMELDADEQFNLKENEGEILIEFGAIRTIGKHIVCGKTDKIAELTNYFNKSKEKMSAIAL